MKKNLFITLGLALGLGIGAVTGLSAKKEVKETKAEDSYYYFSAPSDWGDVKVYAWKDGSGHNADFPGVACTFTGWKNENSEKIWRVPIDVSSFDQFIMSDKNDGTHQSGDLSVSSLTTGAGDAFWLDGSNFGGKYTYSAPSKAVYFLNKDKYLYSDTIYIHAFGGDGNHNETIFPGIQMELVSGRLYRAYVDTHNTTVIFNRGSSGDQNQTGNFTISNEVCVLNTNWTDSWVSLAAAEFVNDYLHLDHTTNDGSCKDLGWFSTLKTEYNKLVNDGPDKDTALATEIVGIEGVSERMTKWAAANGSSFDPSTGFASRSSIVPVMESTTNVATIAIVISVISLIAVGGFFFLRKRKEER